MGIYGNCVIMDHGLGVSSLYGHLSRIDVSPGEVLEQGDTVGLSGATGLAGGDHLHFGLLIGDTYVNPLEWWDRRWIKNNILSQLYPEP
jgi:murein DD-endopeptidase MepM/ murein hydrolase activator NlpD